jgi:DMSO reductase anchor subunit
VSSVLLAASILAGAFAAWCVVRAYRSYSSELCRVLARRLLITVAVGAVLVCLSTFLRDLQLSRLVEDADGPLPDQGNGLLLQEVLFLASVIGWIAVATRRRQLR